MILQHCALCNVFGQRCSSSFWVQWWQTFCLLGHMLVMSKALVRDSTKTMMPKYMLAAVHLYVFLLQATPKLVVLFYALYHWNQCHFDRSLCMHMHHHVVGKCAPFDLLNYTASVLKSFHKAFIFSLVSSHAFEATYTGGL